MRRTFSVVALAATLTLAVGVTAASARPMAESAGDTVTYLTLTGREVQSQEIDLAPMGTFSLGDRFVFSDDLYRHGRKVGFDGGECILVRQDPAADGVVATVSFNCVVTLSLPKGQITLQALITNPVVEEETSGRPFYVAVTGGTQAYRNVRGDAKLVDLAEGETRYNLRLIR